MKPGTRVFLKGYYGEKAAQQVVIASAVDEPLTITGLSSTIDDKIEYNLTTVKKDKEYRLDIKTRAALEEAFRGKIILKTNNKQKPQIDLSIAGSVEKAMKATPEYLYFGVIDTGKGITDSTSLQRSTVLHQLQGESFTIKEIKTGKEWMSAEAAAKEKNREHTVTIKLQADKLPKGNFRETVTIYTQSDKSSDVATVIVEGKVI